MPLLLESYRRSAAADANNLPRLPVSAHDRVAAYVKAKRSEMIDLDACKPITMTKAEVNHCAGFLKSLKGRPCLLIMARRWSLEFGTQSHSMLDELNQQGHLHATENLQTQTRVRANASKDRVYAIRIK